MHLNGLFLLIGVACFAAVKAEPMDINGVAAYQDYNDAVGNASGMRAIDSDGPTAKPKRKFSEKLRRGAIRAHRGMKKTGRKTSLRARALGRKFKNVFKSRKPRNESLAPDSTRPILLGNAENSLGVSPESDA